MGREKHYYVLHVFIPNNSQILHFSFAQTERQLSEIDLKLMIIL